MSENVKKWYVLRAIGGKEKKVKEYIDNEIANAGLQEFVSQVLLPIEKVYQIRNGKKISKERNLFPGPGGRVGGLRAAAEESPDSAGQGGC